MVFADGENVLLHSQRPYSPGHSEEFSDSDVEDSTDESELEATSEDKSVPRRKPREVSVFVKKSADDFVFFFSGWLLRHINVVWLRPESVELFKRRIRMLERFTSKRHGGQRRL